MTLLLDNSDRTNNLCFYLKHGITDQNNILFASMKLRLDSFIVDNFLPGDIQRTSLRLDRANTEPLQFHREQKQAHNPERVSWHRRRKHIELVLETPQHTEETWWQRMREQEYQRRLYIWTAKYNNEDRTQKEGADSW